LSSNPDILSSTCSSLVVTFHSIFYLI
jgi:hypothetical protein